MRDDASLRVRPATEIILPTCVILIVPSRLLFFYQILHLIDQQIELLNSHRNLTDSHPRHWDH